LAVRVIERFPRRRIAPDHGCRTPKTEPPLRRVKAKRDFGLSLISSSDINPAYPRNAYLARMASVFTDCSRSPARAASWRVVGVCAAANRVRGEAAVRTARFRDAVSQTYIGDGFRNRAGRLPRRRRLISTGPKNRLI